eukprot:scaffold27037_cov134-Skeletonema_menzelii.AAC.9
MRHFDDDDDDLYGFDIDEEALRLVAAAEYAADNNPNYDEFYDELADDDMQHAMEASLSTSFAGDDLNVENLAAMEEDRQVATAIARSIEEANSKNAPTDQHQESSLFYDEGLGSFPIGDRHESKSTTHLTTVASAHPQYGSDNENTDPMNLDNAFSPKRDGTTEVVFPTTETKQSPRVRGLTKRDKSGGGKKMRQGLTPPWRWNGSSRKERARSPFDFLLSSPPNSPLERGAAAVSLGVKAAGSALGCVVPPKALRRTKSKKEDVKLDDTDIILSNLLKNVHNWDDADIDHFVCSANSVNESAADWYCKHCSTHEDDYDQELEAQLHALDWKVQDNTVHCGFQQQSLDDTIHFRDVEGDDAKGIDSDARQQYKHHQLNQFRQFRQDFEANLPMIKNPFIKKLYIALKDFMEKMEDKEYTDIYGNPLVYNVLSLPLGLSADQKVVALIYNYITLEEGMPILSNEKNGYMAERSDGTVICNTIEIARRALGDRYFYSFVLGDMHPVAYPHGSTLKEYAGNKTAKAIMKEWKKVLSLLVDDEDVKIGLGSGTAHKAFQELFRKTTTKRMKSNGRFVSAGKDGAEYKEAAHPCVYYNKKYMSHMTPKLEKGKNFYTNLRKARDPTAPEVDFFLHYFNKNSAIFDLCQRAFLDGCSRGGEEKWKCTKAALDKRKKKKKLNEADKKLLAAWDNFQEATSRGGEETWKRTQAALKRRDNGEDAVEGDKKLLARWDNFQEAWSAGKKKGGAVTKAKWDKKKGRTSDTLFLCLRCIKRKEACQGLIKSQPIA